MGERGGNLSTRRIEFRAMMLLTWLFRNSSESGIRFSNRCQKSYFDYEETEKRLQLNEDHTQTQQNHIPHEVVQSYGPQLILPLKHDIEAHAVRADCWIWRLK
jgi:hypothetical protein